MSFTSGTRFYFQVGTQTSHTVTTSGLSSTQGIVLSHAFRESISAQLAAGNLYLHNLFIANQEISISPSQDFHSLTFTWTPTVANVGSFNIEVAILDGIGTQNTTESSIKQTIQFVVGITTGSTTKKNTRFFVMPQTKDINVDSSKYKNNDNYVNIIPMYRGYLVDSRTGSTNSLNSQYASELGRTVSVNNQSRSDRQFKLQNTSTIVNLTKVVSVMLK